MTTPQRQTQDAERHTPAQRPHLRGRGRGGFTLLEILITIAIILLLVGIGVFAVPRLLDTANRGATQSLLAQLEAINTEYKALTASSVNINAANNPNWTSNTQESGNAPGTLSQPLPINNEIDYIARSIERFVAAIYRPGQKDAFANMVASLPTDNLVDTSTQIYNPIDKQQTQAAQTVDDTPAPAGNGYLEIVDGWDSRIVYYEPNNPDCAFLPKRQLPYFASAGPDGRFGDAQLGSGKMKDDPAYQASLDNIYSFEDASK